MILEYDSHPIDRLLKQEFDCLGLGLGLRLWLGLWIASGYIMQWLELGLGLCSAAKP